MADSLQALYSQPMTQQSNVAQDTNQASAGASSAVMGAVNTGIGLATMQTQVEKQKTDLAAQKDDLIVKKYTTFNNFMTTLARSSPEIAKRMIPGMKRISQQMDMPIDDSIYDLQGSEDSWKKRWQAISDLHTKGLSDPKIAAAGMAAAQDFGIFNNMAQNGYDKMKQDSTQAHAASESDKAHASAEDIAETKADATTEAAGGRQAVQADRLQLQKDKMDEGIHQKVLTGISKDEQLKKQLYQVNNLENAIAIFKAGGNPTGQQFEELQQAVRSNLGIKGTSGVNEREATKLKSMGIKVSEFEQWLSGKPIDIRELGGQPLIDHVMDMANNELKQTRVQSEKKLKVLSGGHEDFYKRRSDMKVSLDNYVEGFGDLYKPQGQPSGQSAQTGGKQTMPSPPPKDITADFATAVSRGATQQNVEKQIGRPMSQDEMVAWKKAGGR